MNLELRNRVDNYLKEECFTEPLEFYTTSWNHQRCNFDTKSVEVSDLFVKELGLKEVIINTLNHNLEYASGVYNDIETENSALRSALDIWRHIRKYNPEITIYEVMKCIADNFDVMNLYSHYCCTIERRVFRISDVDEDYPAEIFDRDGLDEFGLAFDEWSEL